MSAAKPPDPLGTAPGGAATIAWRAGIVLLGCLVCQLGAGFFYGTRALAPDVIDELGWTRTMWSSAMAPMLFVSSLTQAFVGAACVRFGVRSVLVVALACLAGAMGMLAQTTSLWHFYVAVILLAVGSAGVGDVTIGATIARWFDRFRGPALGIAYCGSNLGAVVFVHAIASLSSGGSWRDAALRVGLAGSALILPFALFAVREPRASEGSAVEENADDEASASGGADHLSLRTALARPGFWLFYYVLFCYAFAQLGLYDHLLLYLADLGYARMEAAGVLEMTVAAGLAAKVGAGALAMRLRARTALLVNTLGLAASLALLPFADRPGVLPAFSVLFGVTTAARDVLFPLAVAEVYGARAFAALFGFLMTAFFPGGVFGPLAMATTYDWRGSYEAGFALCFTLALGAAGAVYALPRGTTVERP